MRVLIDTHVFIWWTSDVKKLSSRVHNLLLDPSTEAILSVVSIWEMQIKLSLGKLQFKTDLSELVDDAGSKLVCGNNCLNHLVSASLRLTFKIVSPIISSFR